VLEGGEGIARRQRELRVSIINVCFVPSLVKCLTLQFRLSVNESQSQTSREAAHPSPSSLHVLCRCVCLYISTCPPDLHHQGHKTTLEFHRARTGFFELPALRAARSRWWQVRGWRVVVAGAVIRLSFTRTSESKQESKSSCWKPGLQSQQYGPEYSSCALYA